MDENANANVTGQEPVGAQAPAAPSRRRWIWLALATLAVSVLAAFLLLTGYFGTYRYWSVDEVAFATAASAEAPNGDAAPKPKELSQLERKLAAFTPRGVYIVVDTLDNHLRVQKGDSVLRDAVCSAGTGAILEDPRSGKRWVFDSPRGMRRVKEKRKDPVWTKPEWALVEEGEDPSQVSWSDRIDRDTLGEYALYLGDGYMIHGTLYQRYLGLNVTHGCIRLGDEDLEFVYRNTPVGAAVYMY